MAGGYEDDDLGEAETAALDALAENDKKLMQAGENGTLPGVLSDQDEQSPDKVAAAEAAAAPLPTPAPAAETPAAAPNPNDPPAPDAEAPPAPPANETLAQFIARHRAAGKNDDQIAGLVENREKRERREQFKRRTRTPDQIAADRAKVAENKTKITARAAKFDEKLQADPDAAAKALNDEAIERDLAAETEREAALDREEFLARQDDAIEFAQKYVPDLGAVYPEIQAFGGALGYTPEEIDGISDGRDIVVLDLARIAGKLMQAKLIDRQGNMIPQPQPVNAQPRDPRLNAPPAPATHSAPAGTPALPDAAAQAESALRMSDDDFDKLPAADVRRMMGG